MTNSYTYACGVAQPYITSGVIDSNTINSIRQASRFDKLEVGDSLKINGMDILEWINLVNGLLGLPTRDIELEKKYPQLVDLWFSSVNESIKNMNHMISESSLEYTKKLDEYKTFELLKKE
jgi:hypothetical protein